MSPNTEQAPPAWLHILPVDGLAEPTGIAVQGTDILIADHTKNDVLVLDQQGHVKACHSATAPYKPLKAPHGIVALETQIMVADTLNHRIVRLSPDLKYIDERKEYAGRALRRPHALAHSPHELFVADTDNNRLIRILDDGDGEEITTVCGQPLKLDKPCGLGLSPRQLFIADTYQHQLLVAGRDFKSLRVYGGPGTGAFGYPVAVASWQEWFVVSDEFNKRLQLWRADEEGDYWTGACVVSNLCASWLGKPFGVVFNTDGRLFIADRSKAQILIVDFEDMLKASSDDLD